MAQQTYPPMSNTEVSFFCSQMAMILKSGISSVEGISIMLEETGPSSEQELLSAINERLNETGSFYMALESVRVFPDYMLHMTNIGEQTGKLDQVMEALAVHYEREASLAQSVRNALTYPLIMIMMMLLVILVLITKVMPIFNQVFQQLGSEMTGFSRAILEFGSAINRSSVTILAMVIVLALFIVFFTKSRKGREWFQSFASHFTWVRAFSDKIAACRFASGMALTLSSGMNQSECLTMAARLIDSPSFGEKINICQTKVDDGEDLAKALAETGIFSGLYARMTSIGSRTGTLDEVMTDIASKYQDEVDQKFISILSTVEPALVIILSVIVGLILLSVMLPLMGIMSGL